MPGSLLSINDLSVSFHTASGRFEALKNINISVKRGEILAIVGESGSGKSVTSLSVLQLVPAPPAEYTSGAILFNDNNEDRNLLAMPRESLSAIRGNRVAMIFQEPMTSLNPVLTCGFQVSEALRQHRKLSKQAARERTLALFEKVKLPDPQRVFSSYPHQLSGGQKQRVMIAMAMSCGPALLICDEPTTALDVTVQKNILQLIRDLQQQEDIGVIFITHDLGVVAEIADRVAVMYRGEIVEENDVRSIFHAPSHPYTKALLACRPALHPKGERLPVVKDFMGGGEAINPQNDSAGISLQQQAPAVSKEPILQVSHLKVWFPASGKTVTRAVDDVSFDVYAGETLGLVGESGCGKSTLGRAILGLVKTTGGDVLFRGESLVHSSRADMLRYRRQMQIVFQDPYSSLNPRIRIGDAIAEPMLVHGLVATEKERKEKVMAMLEKVGLLPEHYHRYPHEFSGGQRQRIVIARALAVRPAFLVCDESVSALDVSVQAQVLNLLNDLKRELGFTMIFISHDLSVVRYISDRIMVMNRGRIEEIGDAEQVYNHPASPYTRQLIASIPRAQV